MSLVIEEEIYGLLKGSSSLITLIESTSNIKMGVQKTTPTSFPSIVVAQVGGSERVYIGYGASASGSKFAIEDASYQIDIYNQTSPRTNLLIYNAMKMPLMSNGYTKTSDNSILEEELDAFRQITRWSKIKSHTD